MLGDPDGVEAAVDALRPLRGRLGSYFVLGSNDYWAPQPLNYLNYFRRERAQRAGVRGRSDELVRRLEADGWVHLENEKTRVANDGVAFEVLGLDDPHVEYHDLRVAPRTEPDAVPESVHRPQREQMVAPRVSRPVRLLPDPRGDLSFVVRDSPPADQGPDRAGEQPGDDPVYRGDQEHEQACRGVPETFSHRRRGSTA